MMPARTPRSSWRDLWSDDSHDHRGYGGNQMTCYSVALARGADIVVMVHPDHQYTQKLVTAMASIMRVIEQGIALFYKKLPLQNNSDNFVFASQMLVQCVYFGFRIGEISCPRKYFGDSP